jgi:TPR repeat protein
MQFPDPDTPTDTWLWSVVSQSGHAQDYVAFLDHAFEIEAPVMQAVERAKALWDAPQGEACWPHVLRVTEAAAREGDTRAIALMARWTYLGVGRPVDESQAITWLREGAQAGDPRCTLNLGRHLARTDPSSMATQVVPLFERAVALGLHVAHSYWADHDPDRRLEHLELGASQADPTGLYMLASHLKEQADTPEQLRRATDLMREAADKGSSYACLCLGFWYRSGEAGLPLDTEAAIGWFRQGARRGNTDCLTLLARMLLRECTGRRDEAIEAYTWAAIRGSGLNQSLLGDELMFNGRDEHERARGVYWQQKAAQNGHHAACQGLGIAYSQGRGVAVDLAEAARWFLKGAQLGESQSQCSIGCALMNGSGVELDAAAGHAWFQMAALQKDPQGLFLLGLSFAYGNGTDKNLERALECFIEAAKLDHPIAAFEAGRAYLFGNGTPSQKHLAVRWLTAAARLGSNDAKVYLGVMLKCGDGVKPNPERAAQWFREAADDGDAGGMRELGLLHLEGEGVSKDKAEAIRLLCEAARLGDGEAQDWVKRLGAEKPAWLERLVQGLPMVDDPQEGPQTQDP